MPDLSAHPAAVLSSRQSEQLVRPAIERAVALAASTGHPALVRVLEPLGDLEPWDLDHDSGAHVWLHDDATRCTVAAFDPLVEWTLPLGTRMVAAATALRERLVDAEAPGVNGAASSIPWTLGGFAFAAATTNNAPAMANPWREWPRAWLAVPGFVVARMNGVTTAAVTQMVHPGESVASIERAVRKAIDRVVAAGRRPRHGESSLAAQSIRRDPTEVDRAAWIARAQQARDAVRPTAGRPAELRKIVLARPELFEADAPFDPHATAWRLRQRQPNCTVFVIHPTNSDAHFVGATPEMLLRVTGTTASTVALAGTRPRRLDAAADAAEAAALLGSTKDREEHGYVIASLRDNLAPFCRRVDVAPAPHVAHFATVHHLATAISGTLAEPRHILEFLETLHPSPAVGGTPRTAALGWLAAHEGFDRGWYAGPVGWFDAEGRGAFFVAIRSALLRGNTAWAFTGAGIVADSEPSSEWAETALKVRSMAEALVVQAARVEAP